MKKVITFSLWGDNATYTIGAIKNAELAKIFYPLFECWFYIHEETVPKNIIDKLSSFKNTKVILKNGNLLECKPMMWRFEAIDDPNVELMISRDTDTRIYLREKLAVDEWINSDKIFHIMRDHPHHNFKILGGMFGTRKIKEIESWTDLINNFKTNINIIKGYDQDFLADYIYPKIKDNSIIHASFNNYENHSKNFPIEYNDEYNFIGEYVYYDNTRSYEHYTILKEELNKKHRNKIHLITSFYLLDKDDDKSKKRNDELLECLYHNLHNDDIYKIHLFVDDIKSLNKAIEININNKIKIINIGKQPLYSEMFEYSIVHLFDCICMISNSDIYLYKCDLNVLNKLENNVFSLSRHENNLRCEVYSCGSYDAFIFNSKYIKKEILKNLQHIQNVVCADNNVVDVLVDNGLKLYNPCFEIIIIHLHQSELRTYDNDKKITKPKHLIIKKYFIKENYKFNNYFHYLFFRHVDYPGNDIFYKENLSLHELKEIADNDNNVIAFNTLGFFKNNVDINKLVQTDFINNSNHNGLYVKVYQTE
jgi:hypothetical protein